MASTTPGNPPMTKYALFAELMLLDHWIKSSIFEHREEQTWYTQRLTDDQLMVKLSATESYRGTAKIPGSGHDLDFCWYSPSKVCHRLNVIPNNICYTLHAF